MPVWILKVHGCRLHGQGLGGLDGLPSSPSTWVTMTKDIVKASQHDWQLSRAIWTGNSSSVLPKVAVLPVALCDFIYVIYIHHASKGVTYIGNCYLGVLWENKSYMWGWGCQWMAGQLCLGVVETLVLVFDHLWCYVGNLWPSRGRVSVPWGTGLWEGWTPWSQAAGRDSPVPECEGLALYHGDKMICRIFITPEELFSPWCSSSSGAEGEYSLMRQDSISPSKSWAQACSRKKRDIDAPA